jgi:hypothetical protein
MSGYSLQKERVMYQIQCNNQYATSPWSIQNSKPLTQKLQITNTQTVLASERQDVMLSYTTEDGDTVNISLAARSQSAYQNCQEYGQGKRDVSTTYSATSQQDLTMTVHGDLSKEERMELDKVMKTIDQMMTNFVDGHLEPLTAQAEKLYHFDAISNLSLEMSYSRDVLVEAQSLVQTVSDPMNITYDGQGQLVAPTRTGVPTAVAREQSPESQVTAAADDLTTAMAQQLARVRKFGDSSIGALSQIFDKHRQQVKKMNSNDAFGLALIDRIQKNLLAEMLKGQTDSTSEASTATGRARTLVV